MGVPLWVRALLRFDRLAGYAYRAHEIARDELLFAALDPSLRSAVTEFAYAQQRAYLPGGSTFDQGLFDWERSALEHPRVPREGTVLLGAAGGGRELLALRERSYDVVAFEPNPVLVEGSRDIAAAAGGTVLQGSYEDLDGALESKGPLASLRERGPYSLAILGWGSLTHVVDPAQQRAVLRAIKALCPGAPVLLSFFMKYEPKGGHVGRSEQLRRALRGALEPLRKKRGPLAPGLSFESGGGFVYCFTENEFLQLALECGYEALFVRASPFPHALLSPLEPLCARDELFAEQLVEQRAHVVRGGVHGDFEAIGELDREQRRRFGARRQPLPHEHARVIERVIELRVQVQQHTRAVLELGEQASRVALKLGLVGDHSVLRLRCA